MKLQHRLTFQWWDWRLRDRYKGDSGGMNNYNWQHIILFVNNLIYFYFLRASLHISLQIDKDLD